MNLGTRITRRWLWAATWGAVLFTTTVARADVVPFPRIPGGPRAMMLAALAGLVILGFGLVALVWLGARLTQRYRRSGPLNPTPRPTQSDWDAKPLEPKPPKSEV